MGSSAFAIGLLQQKIERCAEHALRRAGNGQLVVAARHRDEARARQRGKALRRRIGRDLILVAVNHTQLGRAALPASEDIVRVQPGKESLRQLERPRIAELRAQQQKAPLGQLVRLSGRRAAQQLRHFDGGRTQKGALPCARVRRKIEQRDISAKARAKIGDARVGRGGAYMLCDGVQVIEAALHGQRAAVHRAFAVRREVVGKNACAMLWQFAGQHEAGRAFFAAAKAVADDDNGLLPAGQRVDAGNGAPVCAGDGFFVHGNSPFILKVKDGMKMNFIRLHSTEDPRFHTLFALYEQSFPLHEQRLPRDQLDALRHPEYHCCAAEENGALCGLLWYWEAASFLYVEHFAILPERRGQGDGSRVLHALRQSPKPIILEIDPPEDETSIRRRDFYLRAGFCQNAAEHIHPAYRKACAPHRLVLLSAPAPLEAGEIGAFQSYLRETVMTFAER